MINRFAIDHKQEEKRILALKNQDAVDYRICCDALGINPEDEFLYEQGLIKKEDVVGTPDIYGIHPTKIREAAQEIYNQTIARGQKPERICAGSILYALNEKGIGSLVFEGQRKPLTTLSTNEAIQAGLEILVKSNMIKDPRRD